LRGEALKKGDKMRKMTEKIEYELKDYLILRDIINKKYIQLNFEYIEMIEAWQAFDEMGIRISSKFGIFILMIIECKPWKCKTKEIWDQHFEDIKNFKIFLRELISLNLPVKIPTFFEL
jgi:hypothetical protein